MPILTVLLLFVTLIALLIYKSVDVPPKSQWPPISEDEFIRRCSPGVDRDTALKVRRIIAEQLGVDYHRVYPEQRFVEDLGCD